MGETYLGHSDFREWLIIYKDLVSLLLFPARTRGCGGSPIVVVAAPASGLCAYKAAL